jgi:coenzyme F420-reducing hydrogenase delta subunit
MEDRVINLALSDLVVCHLCQGILWLPVACQTCETAYCMSCIKAWLLESEEPVRCPNECSTYIQRKCPTAITHILTKLQVICRYKSNGCTEVLLYDRLETHEEVCGYRLLTCSGCKEQVVKNNFKEHYDHCLLIPLTCTECSTVYERQDAHEHTEMKCLFVQLHQLRDRQIKNEQIQSDKIKQIENQLTEIIQQLRSIKEK